MNKKILSLLALMLCAVMMLTACGSKETNTDNNASGKSERVVIYTAAEDERIAYIQQELDAKFPNYEIVILFMIRPLLGILLGITSML